MDVREVEVEPEVAAWLLTLTGDDYAQAERAIELLAEKGYKVGMPTSRFLGEDLHELRFRCQGVARRITYWLPAPGRAVLLTTFRKQRDNERDEIDRARRALARCREGGEAHQRR